MNNDNQNIVEECRLVVKEHLSKNSDANLKYHNWKHTNKVYRYVNEFAENTSDLSYEDMECLQLAALFHDSYFFEGREKHEEKGAAFAASTLAHKDFPSERIETVGKLILATQVNYSTQNKLEEIICDADMAHLGEKDYLATSFVRLYEETKALCNISVEKWVKETIDLFNNHSYSNEYAKSKLTPGKMENEKQLETMAEAGIENIESEAKDEKKKKGKKKKDAITPPDRGIETVFRVSLRNHVNLSILADNKANTLISVNAIIISIVLSALFPKFDKNQYLLIPALTLLSFSIITIIMAIVSTIPRTTHGLLTHEDVRNKRGNLLFFGNFHQMAIDDYEWGMDELMKDRDYLYKSLTRDLFYLGKVLKQKYAYLRIAYFAFVIGLCASILLFVFSIPKGMV